MPESREQMNNSPTRSSVTPTNELPECSFQGKAKGMYVHESVRVEL